MIEITLGTIAPNDCIDTLRQSVDFLPEGTPVRVVLTEEQRAMYGWISGVRLDTGRRGSVRDDVYSESLLVTDIPPNVVCYLVRDEVTGDEFECAPSKVLPYTRTQSVLRGLSQSRPERHDYEPGDSTHPMAGDPNCRVCGETRRQCEGR